MDSGDFPQTPLLLRHLLLELSVKLFTIGIFSVEEGSKAWFELILVTAAICASGYLLWWQVPLLIIVVILSPIAAGMFSLLAPVYMNSENLTATNQFASTIQFISEYNLKEILKLSGGDLEQRLKQIHEVQKIFNENPNLVEQISKLQSALDNINQTHDIAVAKVTHNNKVKERKRYEEAELKRKEWEDHQENLKKIAELKARKEKWLNEERRNAQFTGGCPPYNKKCRDGYPIKVTIDKKEDGFDGIIWKLSDTQYEGIEPKWCYESVEEAEKEHGKYKFRRPKNSRGKPRK